jgi:hypothetical protein
MNKTKLVTLTLVLTVIAALIPMVMANTLVTTRLGATYFPMHIGNKYCLLTRLEYPDYLGHLHPVIGATIKFYVNGNYAGSAVTDNRGYAGISVDVYVTIKFYAKYAGSDIFKSAMTRELTVNPPHQYWWR